MRRMPTRRVRPLAGAAVVLGVVALLGTAMAQAARPVADDIAATPTAPTPAAQFAGDPYSLATCPVSGEPFGKDAVTATIDGRQFRFCCGQCEARMKADPAKYIPAVDAAMTAKQLPYYPLKTCVVMTDDELIQGETLDVIYKNRLVRLCCPGCTRRLERDPAKYFAALDAAVIKAQTPSYPLDGCVVGSGQLGSMGKTVDVVIGNRLVRLCCKGCEGKLRKNPTAAFAKIDAAKATAGEGS